LKKKKKKKKIKIKKNTIVVENYGTIEFQRFLYYYNNIKIIII